MSLLSSPLTYSMETGKKKKAAANQDSVYSGTPNVCVWELARHRLL
jgi:hypothetical protein